MADAGLTYGYYPGCSQKGSAREYELSLLKVAGKLGIDLKEIDDWSCCGATSAHATNHRLANALAMRNMLLAEQQGLETLVAPCAACFNRLITTKAECRNHPELRKDVEEVLSASVTNTTRILSVIDLFDKAGNGLIGSKRVRDMKGLKAACYYGCLLVRPQELIDTDDCEQPDSMERIVKATGADVVEWNYRTECCGAAHSISRRDIVVDLSKRIIDDALMHGANVMIVACPMCHTNLDMRQRVMRRSYPGHREIPVLYLTELIGLSLGFTVSELGIDLHYVRFNMPGDNMNQTVHA